MPGKKSYLTVALVLVILPFLVTSYKYYSQSISLEDIIPREVYEVTLELDVAEPDADAFIKVFVPQSDHRQRIENVEWNGDSLELEVAISDAGKRLRWNIHDAKDHLYSLRFDVEGRRVEYNIPTDSPFETKYADSMESFLLSEPFIQSSHSSIDSLARTMKNETILATLKANYDYVNGLQDSYTRVLTDAVSALESNRASCNGKSRLFVALCRAQGLPARVVGGAILEHVQKRTSHLWTEVYYMNTWIPFDPTNGHFATLPAHYLELYTGDEFLLTHNPELNFDYQFIINKKYRTLTSEVKGPQLWPLLQDMHLSLNLLRTILLLPLAALIIAIFRNVVGLKTFGILLPALIGLALVNVDIGIGLLAFLIVTMVVTLLHSVLERWSLLHVPKVVIILTCCILTLMALGFIGVAMEWEAGELMIYLPIVIISITAERFAKVLTEENLRDALNMMVNTFVLALLTCLIFQSRILLGIFLTYPEQYLTILFLMLVLGRWIGLRVSEYGRFAPSLNT